MQKFAGHTSVHGMVRNCIVSQGKVVYLIAAPHEMLFQKYTSDTVMGSMTGSRSTRAAK